MEGLLKDSETELGAYKQRVTKLESSTAQIEMYKERAATYERERDDIKNGSASEIAVYKEQLASYKEQLVTCNEQLASYKVQETAYEEKMRSFAEKDGGESEEVAKWKSRAESTQEKLEEVILTVGRIEQERSSEKAAFENQVKKLKAELAQANKAASKASNAKTPKKAPRPPPANASTPKQPMPPPPPAAKTSNIPSNTSSPAIGNNNIRVICRIRGPPPSDSSQMYSPLKRPMKNDDNDHDNDNDNDDDNDNDNDNDNDDSSLRSASDSTSEDNIRDDWVRAIEQDRHQPSGDGTNVRKRILAVKRLEKAPNHGAPESSSSSSSSTTSWGEYDFDAVFSPENSTEELYNSGGVRDMVKSVCDGNGNGNGRGAGRGTGRATVIAYGVTGSGKTTTIFGGNGSEGICMLALRQMFDDLSSRDDVDSFTVKIGAVEIYNEAVRDLLSTGSAKELTMISAADAEAAIDVIEKASEERVTSSTTFNATSSRSHLIVRIEITQVIVGVECKGELNMVDLAGSERLVGSAGATVSSKLAKETASINSSLSALGNVLNSLGKNQGHIPYRNSKLTYLLANALGQDTTQVCKTAVVLNVSPCTLEAKGDMDKHDKTTVSESVNSITFGLRAKDVSLPSEANVETKNLKETIKRLKQQGAKQGRTLDEVSWQLTKERKLTDSLKVKISELLTTKNAAPAEASGSNSKRDEVNRAVEGRVQVLKKSYTELGRKLAHEKDRGAENSRLLENTRNEFGKLKRSFERVSRERDMVQKRYEAVVGKAAHSREMHMRRGRNNKNDSQEDRPTLTVRGGRKKSEDENGGGAMSKSIDNRGDAAASRENDGDSVNTTSLKLFAPNGKLLNFEPTEDSATIKEIKALMNRYEPSKVSKLSDLLDKFNGKEKVLLEKLKKRYENAKSANARIRGEGGSGAIQRKQKLSAEHRRYKPPNMTASSGAANDNKYENDTSPKALFKSGREQAAMRRHLMRNANRKIGA